MATKERTGGNKLRRKDERTQGMRRALMSVYPVEKAELILGKGSRPYNQAIECWSYVQAAAMLDNENLFTPDEWELIAAAVDAFTFDPYSDVPAATLAAILQAPAWQRKQGAPGRSVAERIAPLDYVHAWAIIQTCQWHARFPERAEWWKLVSRGIE